MGFSDWMKKLTASAEDPRLTAVPSASDQDRHHDLLEKVRHARANLEAARTQLQAKIAEARQKQQQFEAQKEQDPFTIQLQKIVADEVRALESEVGELNEEDRELALLEHQLATQADALSAHQQALEARYRATAARAELRKELGDLPGELAGLGMALEKAEQRSGDVQARASALEHLTNLSGRKTGVAFGNPAAQELANRYASEASLEQEPAVKQLLGQGFKTLIELEYEYRQLLGVLDRRKQTDPLSVTYIPPLAEDIYKQGQSVLRDGLELVQAIRSPSIQKLEAEIHELEEEVASLRKDGGELAATKARFREERIASHRQRLDMVRRQQLRVDELLHQADRCVASLNQTRIELAGLKADGARTSVEAVTETLQKTLNEAKEVQEELKKLGI